MEGEFYAILRKLGIEEIVIELKESNPQKPSVPKSTDKEVK